MFRFDPALKVYLHREPVDGRKAINGLALLVEQALGLDPADVERIWREILRVRAASLRRNSQTAWSNPC